MCDAARRQSVCYHITGNEMRKGCMKIATVESERSGVSVLEGTCYPQRYVQCR
jgi:hypothetical protein